MSYTIRYGSEPKAAMEQNRKMKSRKLTYIAVILILLTALAVPQSRDFLQQLLFPWMNETIVEAYGEMIARIREGEAVAVSILEFCREVIDRGEIPV